MRANSIQGDREDIYWKEPLPVEFQWGNQSQLQHMIFLEGENVTSSNQRNSYLFLGLQEAYTLKALNSAHFKLKLTEPLPWHHWTFIWIPCCCATSLFAEYEDVQTYMGHYRFMTPLCRNVVEGRQ